MIFKRGRNPVSVWLFLVSQSNQELFRAEPSSEEWKAYVEYVDDMIIDGFFNSIECSLKFFLENTGEMFVDKQSTEQSNNIKKPSLSVFAVL